MPLYGIIHTKLYYKELLVIMQFLKKIAAAVLSGTVFFSAFSGASLINAEELSGAPEQPIAYISDDYIKNNAIDDIPDDIEDIIIDEDKGEDNVTDEIIDPDLPETETTASDFDVFDIYDAHMSNITTTTTTTTTATTTTTVTSRDCSRGLKGIDVSQWQGDIDWNKVKKDNVNFAVIRAGYGKYASQEDPKFDTNMVNAHKAGMDCGVYWYSYATSVAEAYTEAEVCYSIIKDYNFEYPVFFDIEEDSQRNLSTAEVSAIIDAFCSTMEKKGYYVSIYSYASFLNTKVYSNVLDKYDVWVAHFDVSAPSYNRQYGIWQYSSTGRINGISGDVDLDYAYKDYPYLMKMFHKNGY